MLYGDLQGGVETGQMVGNVPLVERPSVLLVRRQVENFVAFHALEEEAEYSFPYEEFGDTRTDILGSRNDLAQIVLSEDWR